MFCVITPCCVTLSCREDFPLQIEPVAGQTMDVAEVLLGQLLSFIGITYRNVGEGSLTGKK